MERRGHRQWRLRTFRCYLSNVLWHVWGIGRRQGHRNEGFMQTPLQFYLSSSLWEHVHVPPSENKTSRHTSRIRSYSVCVCVCLGYLDIHFKQHLNQAVLKGSHPLLIKTLAVPDKLICLKNGGDINSTWLRQWPLLLFVLNPSSTSLYLHSLESLCVQSLFISSSLLCFAPSFSPPFPLLSTLWYKHLGSSRQEHHQHAQWAVVMQIASMLVMEGTAIDRQQETAAAEELLFGLALILMSQAVVIIVWMISWRRRRDGRLVVHMDGVQPLRWNGKLWILFKAERLTEETDCGPHSQSCQQKSKGDCCGC